MLDLGSAVVTFWNLIWVMILVHFLDPILDPIIDAGRRSEVRCSGPAGVSPAARHFHHHVGVAY